MPGSWSLSDYPDEFGTVSAIFSKDDTFSTTKAPIMLAHRDLVIDEVRIFVDQPTVGASRATIVHSKSMIQNPPAGVIASVGFGDDAVGDTSLWTFILNTDERIVLGQNGLPAIDPLPGPGTNFPYCYKINAVPVGGHGAPDVVYPPGNFVPKNSIVYARLENWQTGAPIMLWPDDGEGSYLGRMLIQLKYRTRIA
jgi:hypothetical protein